MAKRKAGWGGRREGAGRPPRLKEPVTRWVKLERSDVESAEKIAEERDISFAEIVRRALRAYLKRHRRR